MAAMAGCEGPEGTRNTAAVCCVNKLTAVASDLLMALARHNHGSQHALHCAVLIWSTLTNTHQRKSSGELNGLTTLLKICHKSTH
jgi:hypothetical protein